MMTRESTSHSALMSLEAAASSARGGFACMFSSSDEYENALITQRRAQGRYGVQRARWPLMAFIGTCSAMVAAVMVYFVRS
ncbi:hypothetical protein RPMA_16470 [Tardiphaga alba]|uniref:Uncharacterized protein n=1 Tax=Tardiphaga alba TaxID=340268 RepID=A0ABX8AEM9_9BRAD|nr:hypothetical protein [Tardiphaga alba]QUS40250.1 hypothetical protein RPMA_16470 [Tardiphaga alba]